MKTMTKLLQLIVIGLVLLPGLSLAFQARCINIADGDTVTVLTDDKKQIKIRLYGIDSPESGQPFGANAKRQMADMCGNRDVEIREMDTDRYGRMVALITPVSGGPSLNEVMVSSGLAWVYTKYCTIDLCQAWRNLEEDAKTRRAGLWAENAIPPWEWRRGNTTQSAETAPQEQQPSAGQALSGNVSSGIYHGPSCRHYNCKNCSASFKTKAEAESAGYRACKTCGGR